MNAKSRSIAAVLVSIVLICAFADSIIGASKNLAAITTMFPRIIRMSVYKIAGWVSTRHMGGRGIVSDGGIEARNVDNRANRNGNHRLYTKIKAYH